MCRVKYRMNRPEKRHFFAPNFAGLRFFDVLPTLRRARVFPFDRSNTAYFYNARSAIYTLAKLWDLAGKEVLFPAYCCGVDLLAMLAAGARPRFYPVHEGMRVDAREVVSMIGPETKAIYLIHYFGFPGPIDELSDACRNREVLLIEDCALSLFSKSGNRPLGSFGDAAVFSLYKTLSVPSGGALIVNNGHRSGMSARNGPPFISTLTHLVSLLETGWDVRNVKWGQKLTTAVRAAGRKVKRSVKAEPVIEVLTDAFDPSVARFRMSRISHWIIKRTDPETVVQARRSNYRYLDERLRQIATAVFSDLPEGVCPLFYPVLFQDNRAAMQRLWNKGVQAWAWWWPSPALLEGHAFPEVDFLRRSVVAIPCHEGLDQETLRFLADEVAAAIIATGSERRNP
jgi:dTDP-4-amino-4,6-dideoxygalactose transaminase